MEILTSGGFIWAFSILASWGQHRVLALTCGLHLSLWCRVSVLVCGGVAGACCPDGLPAGPSPPSYTHTDTYTHRHTHHIHTAWLRVKRSNTGLLLAKASKLHLTAEAQWVRIFAQKPSGWSEVSWDDPQSWRFIATFHHCFFSSQLLLWVLGRKGFPHLSWTRNYMMLPEHGPQASLGGIHPCALGYESSSTGLGWFVHEGTWWLGHGRECGASPNGKSVAHPCMLPVDWQEQRETSQWVTRPHCWHSSGCILGDLAPGPLIHARCCRWRHSKAYQPFHLLNPDS